MAEVNSRSFFVSASGGVIDFVKDGEVLASLAVPAGKVPVMDYLSLVPLGADVEISEGLAVLQPPSSVGVQPYGKGSHETGANPDFQVTSASRFEREMRVTLARLQAKTNRLEARERALQRVERVPDNPLVEPAEAPAPSPDQDEKSGV